MAFGVGAGFAIEPLKAAVCLLSRPYNLRNYLIHDDP